MVLSVFKSNLVAVSVLSRKSTGTCVAHVKPSKYLLDKLSLELSRMDKAVISMNVEGIATDLRIDSAEHILKQESMSEFSTLQSKIFYCKCSSVIQILCLSTVLRFIATPREYPCRIGPEFRVQSKASTNKCSPILILGFQPDNSFSY